MYAFGRCWKQVWCDVNLMCHLCDAVMKPAVQCGARTGCLVCAEGGSYYHQSTLHREAWIEECQSPAPGSNRSHNPPFAITHDKGGDAQALLRQVLGVIKSTPTA